MSILKEGKLQKYRNTIFLLCLLCAVMPLRAQESNSNIVKTENNEKQKVNVLMGEQDVETVLQSYSTVKGERLLHRPTFQMESFLDGTLAGLVVETEQGHATTQNGLRLRGRSLMIVVDGIPRSDANIPASQIESVTVIKDALGLSMMGMSSGNGILYIETKRGKKSSLQIEFTAQIAMKQHIYRPKFLGSLAYSNLLNEALANDGKAPMYSQKDLDLYKSGERPYTHPDIDWYKEVTRKTAPTQQYNLNMHGGGENTRYFVDLNVYDEAGFFKEDNSINSYSTRETYKKYSLRTNLDIKLGESTFLKANVFGQMFREITPGQLLVSKVYPAMHSTPNNAYPTVNPDGSIAGNSTYLNNIYGQTIHSGYYIYPKSDLNIDLSLEHKFKGKLEGLYLNGMYSYNSTYREELNRSKTFGVSSFWKDPNDNTDPIDSDHTVLRSAGGQSNTTSYSKLNRLQYGEFAAGYDFKKGLHTSKTKVAYSFSNYLLRSLNIPSRKNTIGFRTEYDFDKRFMAELVFTAMNLNTLKPGDEWGMFPAGGIGWDLSKESFLVNSKKINKLKFRATYGINGNDGTGHYYRQGTDNPNYYYTYLKYYKAGAGVNLGGTSTSQATLIENGLPYITKWEKIKKLTIGIDLEAFDRTLIASVEFFNNNYTDKLQKRVSQSSVIGIAYPNEHVGEYRQNGIELEIAYNNTFGNFTVYADANATFYKTKLKANGENTYPEAYMQQVGETYDRPFGFVADGLFKTDAELTNYLSRTEIEGYIPQKGDIRYRDLNNDGTLDGKDVKAIGTSAPLIEYGFFLGAEWKGIGLSMQWAGIANRNLEVKDMPFSINSEGGYGQAQVEHLDRWTPANIDARYPRLSAGENSYNERTSSFWVKNAGFLRLKNIELSYTLPEKWTSAMRLSKVKFFANAYNLITITGLKDRDPEVYRFMNGTATGYVPNFKAYNFGLNIQF